MRTGNGSGAANDVWRLMVAVMVAALPSVLPMASVAPNFLPQPAGSHLVRFVLQVKEDGLALRGVHAAVPCTGVGEIRYSRKTDRLFVGAPQDEQRF